PHQRNLGRGRVGVAGTKNKPQNSRNFCTYLIFTFFLTKHMSSLVYIDKQSIKPNQKSRTFPSLPLSPHIIYLSPPPHL
ncbi:hypothetical protein COCCADRAFT_92067, partial [Bipolaris zeicola 26-R-13]